MTKQKQKKVFSWEIFNFHGNEENGKILTRKFTAKKHKVLQDFRWNAESVANRVGVKLNFRLFHINYLLTHLTTETIINLNKIV